MIRLTKVICFAVVATLAHSGQVAETIRTGGRQQQGGFIRDETGLQQTDVFFAGELGYKEFRIPALVVTKSGTLLAISEAGQTAQQLSSYCYLAARKCNSESEQRRYPDEFVEKE